MRRRREHNASAWSVWHIAHLGAYPPENPADFVRLPALQWAAPQAKASWKDSQAAFSAWAKAAVHKG